MQASITVELLNSLSKLSKQLQKRVQKTLLAYVRNQAQPGLRLHKIAHPSDCIWSLSANRDVRIILSRTAGRTTFLYVAHHDDAYEWVSRRKFFSTQNTFRIIEVETQQQQNRTEHKLPPEQVPEYLDMLKKQLSNIEDEDTLLDFIAEMPIGEDYKSDLLEYVIAGTTKYTLTPNYHVKALDDAELEAALRYPLDLWRVFLHPRQEAIASLPPTESRYITGGPGTGKTVCLVHRIKAVLSQISPDQSVLLVTYKTHLYSYLLDMLRKLNIDTDRVIIVDVSQMNNASLIHTTSEHGATSVLDEADVAWKNNCFIVSQGILYFHGEYPTQLSHIFVDEYQDFRGQQYSILADLAEIAPFTICLDYSQAVYRYPSKHVRDVLNSNFGSLAALTHCYRLNDQILHRVRNVLLTARVVSTFAVSTKFQFEMGPFEVTNLASMVPAVTGPAPLVYSYGSREDLDTILVSQVRSLRQAFADDEIVVTAFFPEIYRHARGDLDFQSDTIPQSLREHYRFVYTLKGMEWKAGIIILDDAMCDLLTLNRSLFTSTVPDGFKGSGDNIKRMFNLLYVALSRFRDFVCICYPEKYSVVLDAMF